MPPQLTVVAAPDSFKGSLSAREVADAMAVGVRRALGASAAVTALPMADGGEGTLDALLDAWAGTEATAQVTDALGRPCSARYGLSADSRTAVIEAAEANGLPQVSDVPLRPLEADSAGVGELALAALEAGAEELLLCIGGSATTDGGAGVLRALGALFLDADGQEIPPGGGGLSALERIDLDGLPPRAREARWRIAVDVDNPLVGPRGAAAVFGPQKGATEDDVEVLDAGLGRLAAVLARTTDASAAELSESPGTGAAGGLPVALSAVLGAEVVTGSQLVAEAVGLSAALAEADLVLTGEGSFDSQSLHGKVVDGVRARTPDGAALVVIAGRVALPAAEAAEAGITAALSIAPGPATLEELGADAAELVAEAAENACRLIAHGR